jgi:hypothetical protein
MMIGFSFSQYENKEIHCENLKNYESIVLAEQGNPQFEPTKDDQQLKIHPQYEPPQHDQPEEIHCENLENNKSIVLAEQGNPQFDLPKDDIFHNATVNFQMIFFFKY